MANLETRIYTYPPIPLADVTPLEKLVLTHVLECSETEAGLVLFTDVGPINPINVKRRVLLDAFGASAPQADSALNAFIGSRILALIPTSPDGGDIAAEIDLSEFPWQFVVQDIVARSPGLPEVTVIQWMNHPSQRLETYGASVSLITDKGIHHATSEDLLKRFRLQDRALMPPVSPPALLDAAPVVAPRSFTVGEMETALCIWEAMLYFRGLHEDHHPVPDGVVRMSELWDATGWQAMRAHVLAIVPLVEQAYTDLSDALEEGGFTFDFIPAVVGALDWSEYGPHRDGEPEEFLETVMASVAGRRRDVAAEALSGENRLARKS
ncbi:hypothetical protein P9A16_21390 [Shinella sp. 838]|uniref:hypothetical protein n=1 Tax=unclassified Shinella TaxID=2643062 RepID=UPI000437C08C|nr:MULTISPECIES: hypothetical protein [unclassified Shinella]EYR77558.1 hypothetical protein SHLA_47c000080 [Shinella sp. DD12]MCA0339178.1 hypothetical protein [Pseudomonadota bacterium]MDG4673686.1 hypothetical protein [Shinella sp. 838]